MPMTKLADLLLREALGTGPALLVLPDFRPTHLPGRGVA
jgi:hypothetical protein